MNIECNKNNYKFLFKLKMVNFGYLYSICRIKTFKACKKVNENVLLFLEMVNCLLLVSYPLVSEAYQLKFNLSKLIKCLKYS